MYCHLYQLKGNCSTLHSAFTSFKFCVCLHECMPCMLGCNENSYKQDGSAFSELMSFNLVIYIKKSEKVNVKGLLQSNFNFFSSAVALAVSILTTNQWEQSIQADRLCCHQNFKNTKISIKVYIGSSPLSNYLGIGNNV